MTFREIPQFTPDGNYMVNMPMEFLIKQIDEWVQEDDLQLNPDFQRGHVWFQEQQEKYIEFVLRGGKSGKDIYFNDPNWRTIKKQTGYNDFVCVDGLQRITAIRRFLNNEIKVFGQYYKDFNGRTEMVVHSLVIHVNNLKTKKEVLQWYIEMNEGGTPHSKAEIDRVKRMMNELE